MNINFDYISQFLNDIYVDDDYLELRKFGLENNIPIMKLESKEFIKSLLKIYKPKKILEIGTAIGYSSLVMEKYSNADILTIEKSSDMYEIALSNFKKYNKNIKIINEDAIKALNELEQGFDFVFVDANKAHYKDYFNRVNDDLLINGGIIVCDNILFRGEVTNDDLVEKRQITIVKRLRDFLSYITDLDGIHTSVLPIGDGITVSIKEK